MRVDWILDPVLELPRSAKRLIAILVDAALAILAVWIAMYLRLGEFVPLSGQTWPAAVGASALLLGMAVLRERAERARTA